MELLWPGAIALLFAALFLFAAGIFLLALQYHKHGRLSWRRTITSLVVVFYVFGLLGYTMLPLPETRDAFCRPGVVQTQLVPFQFFEDFNVAWEGGRRAFLTSFQLWQVLFNVLLFIPVGILAVRWARANVLTGTLLGLALSLAIEATQYTGIWGVYTCAYRVADVDDLIVNTSGAFLGTLLAYLPVFAFLSAPNERDAAHQPPRPITRARRALAGFFDLAFITAFVLAVSLVLEVAERLGLSSAHAEPLQSVISVAAILAVVIFPSMAPGRATLGQRCTWFQATNLDGGGISAGRALGRTLLGLGGIYLANTILAALPSQSPLALLAVALFGYTVLSVAWLAFDASARGISARLTGTAFADRRARPWPYPARHAAVPREG